MSNTPQILVLSETDEPQFRMLEGLPHIIGSSPAALAQATAEAEVILHWGVSRDQFRSIFLTCPKLRWVHSRSAGLDSILFPELVESSIPLTNGTGVFSQSLGEFALAAILYFAKDFPRMLRNQRASRWEQFDVEEIAGQTVGIVGYGDIGRAVASRCHAMGMHVLALKRHAPSTHDPLIDKFYKPEQLSELLSLCDYVVVAAPLTPETHHMISDARFAVMKSSAIILNVGRGPVIDQAAMVRALNEGKIRGAGLDVFEKEPIPAGDPIYQMENVLLSPHCADHTKDWLNDAMRFFIHQYERFKSGQSLENIVQKNLGY